MAEKSKRKPFLSLKMFNGGKTSVPASPITKSPPVLSKSRASNADSKNRKFSAGGIKDLVQCPLCMEVFNNPKMLPCQHTFCLACLIVYISDNAVTTCPICRTRIQVPNTTFVNDLPSNLYIDSLLQLVGTTSDSSTPAASRPGSPERATVELFAAGVRCTHCHSLCDNLDVKKCDHCKQKYCQVCWSQHLDDMQTQIGSILKQLDTAANKLNHKIENYKDRCEHLVTRINLAAEEKVSAIMEAKDKLHVEAAEIQKHGDLTASALKASLDQARDMATKAMGFDNSVQDKERVKTFVNLHRNALHLLSDVNKWDTQSFVFDQDQFCIERDAAVPLDAESDDPLPEYASDNPLDSEDNLVMHYRTRNFVPHHMWRKTCRPCGVNVSPWTGHMYVCGLDSHSVACVERSSARVVSRLTHESMLCPVHVAFMYSLGEVYVTDKWKHCVHVFNKEGEYLRCIGQKGSRPGTFRSPEGIATDNANLHIYVVDTGNDRVQVLQPDGKFVDQYGVTVKQQPSKTPSPWHNIDATCTELNNPTSVAVTNNRVIILDSGNRRVKIYNKADKTKITEFGSMGQRKGQFRQPEVLAVDPMGFILVGDSGNSRVQVFKQNGQLVRVFGRYGTEPGKFGWISGIHVTKQMDIIVSDSKNHCVNIM